MSSSKSFKSDWITVAVLVVAFFGYFEHTQPFYRQFKLSDSKLQHPFAHTERVTDIQLYILTTLIPMAAIGLVKVSKKRFCQQQVSVHATIVGLWVALTVAAVFTDILKDWIGNPRPDFLQRCGAVSGTPTNVYVGVDVCSSPLGVNRLADGMKSTPSGHSSMSFASFFYLFLWLSDAGHIAKINRWAWTVLQSLPIFLASYIAFSRTQDYRHHFFDVCLGSAIGVVVGWLSYKKYHV